MTTAMHIKVSKETTRVEPHTFKSSFTFKLEKETNQNDTATTPFPSSCTTYRDDGTSIKRDRDASNDDITNKNVENLVPNNVKITMKVD